MSVITLESFAKAKRPGVFAFTQLMYKEHPEYWPMLFYKTNSTLPYEELVAGNTFGLVPTKTEGAKTQYASESQAHTTRATHVVYAMGYILTFEERFFNMYERLGKRRGARLARSFKRTKDVVHANIFNRAFNSSYTYGDGKELCATDHPTLVGSQSNELAISVDMSETAIEDLCIMMRKATDNVGNKIALQPAKMAYGPDNIFEACRILESERQSGNANNDVNALKSKGKIPMHFDNPYFDDDDAFFVLSDIAQTEEGFVHFMAKEFAMEMDKDSDTFNEKHVGFEMYSATVGDHRAVFGSPGA